MTSQQSALNSGQVIRLLSAFIGVLIQVCGEEKTREAIDAVIENKELIFRATFVFIKAEQQSPIFEQFKDELIGNWSTTNEKK